MSLAPRTSSTTRLSPATERSAALGIAEFALNNALFDHTSDAIALLTPEGVILDVNRRWESIRGIPRRQQIGQRIREFATAGSEEANTESYLRALDGSIHSPIVRIAATDGTCIYMEFSTAMIPAGAGHVVLSIGRDVTGVVLVRQQLEASERKYRLLLEKVPDIVWRAALDGKVLFVSPKVQAVCGFSAAELVEAPASFWFDRIHPSDLARVQREFAQLATHGGYEAEYRWQRRDGAWIWIHAQAAAVEQEGRVVAEGTFDDITTRKHLEDQVRQSQKMEAIGRLTGGVAHDFNNLLAIILGNGQILLDNLAEQDPRREEADAILEAGNRAAALTRQLLMFSRHQIVRPECVEVNAIVRGVDKMLRRIIGEDVELRLRLADHAGHIMADAGEIEQVIMNLVVNARDAMPRGGQLTIDTTDVTIDAEYVELHPDAAPGRYLVLSVTDTGCGMDHETKRRAFEPFFTTKASGTGLGLATCYGIVRGCRGHISLYSEVGMGSVFKVYFPLNECHPRNRARGETRDEVHGTESILLIEDDDQLRKIIRRVLESRGYSVIAANGSAEAIEYCDSHPDHVDLVLSDMVMPGMGGPETVEYIRQHRPSAKVLFMSGYSDHAVFRDRSAKAEVHFIQKPFMPQDLALKLREVLDSPPTSDTTTQPSANATE